MAEVKHWPQTKKIGQIQLCKDLDFGQGNLFAFDKGQK